MKTNKITGATIPFDWASIDKMYCNYGDGDEINIVFCDCNKNYVQLRPDTTASGERIWSLNPNVDPFLPNWPDVINPEKGRIIIMEDEESADRLNRWISGHEIGWWIATASVGGKKNGNHWSEILGKYRRIADNHVIVLIPQDAPLSLTFAREVCTAFLTAGCRDLKLALYDEGFFPEIEGQVYRGHTRCELLLEIDARWERSLTVTEEILALWENNGNSN